MSVGTMRKSELIPQRSRSEPVLLIGVGPGPGQLRRTPLLRTTVNRGERGTPLSRCLYYMASGPNTSSICFRLRAASDSFFFCPVCFPSMCLPSIVSSFYCVFLSVRPADRGLSVSRTTPVRTVDRGRRLVNGVDGGGLRALRISRLRAADEPVPFQFFEGGAELRLGYLEHPRHALEAGIRATAGVGASAEQAVYRYAVDAQPFAPHVVDAVVHPEAARASVSDLGGAFVEDGVRGIIRGAHGTSIPMGRVPGLKAMKSQGPFYASRCILARPARSFPGGYYAVLSRILQSDFRKIFYSELPKIPRTRTS